MAIKHIPQPYIVYAPWDESREDALRAWLEENVLSYYLVTFIPNGSWILPARSDRSAESERMKGATLQFHFECPRDAMLFKLSWGER